MTTVSDETPDGVNEVNTPLDDNVVDEALAEGGAEDVVEDGHASAGDDQHDALDTDVSVEDSDQSTEVGADVTSADADDIADEGTKDQEAASGEAGTANADPSDEDAAPTDDTLAAVGDADTVAVEDTAEDAAEGDDERDDDGAAPVGLQLDPGDDEWWRSAVFYQIYPRSFSDLSGDGVGDLAGVIDKLGYLELLGIDAIWLSPITVSPMADHGYDVSDPRDIDPLFGDVATFEALIADAHERGIRVTMDLVPNHTSDQHRWFQEALAAAPGSRERERYIFRDGTGDNGDEPPNNWVSIFGGPAWHRVTEADGSPGQWYLHIFAPEQPDLNWENPEVFDDLEATLRFWLDRGVDGFRIDVAHGMAKPEGLPDMDTSTTGLLINDDDDPRFNNPGVHAIHRQIRAVLNDYPGAANVGEIWVDDNERFAEYVRPDELHLGFNFRLAQALFDAPQIRDAIENSLEAVSIVDAVPTWTLSNHDVEREVTRYGRSVQGDIDSDVDLALGTQRARAMILVKLALPGTVFIYNGAELGLPNVDLPDEALQDPVWERSGNTIRGRDGCRVPLPWEGDEAPFGFSESADTWLPMPESWGEYSAEAQLEDINSMVSLYRQAIELRYARAEFVGDEVEWYGAPDGCLAFRITPGLLTCALNTTDAPVPLPPGDVLLSSAPLIDGKLPANSAAWIV